MTTATFWTLLLKTLAAFGEQTKEDRTLGAASVPACRFFCYLPNPSFSLMLVLFDMPPYLYTPPLTVQLLLFVTFLILDFSYCCYYRTIVEGCISSFGTLASFYSCCILLLLIIVLSLGLGIEEETKQKSSYSYNLMAGVVDFLIFLF